MLSSQFLKQLVIRASIAEKGLPVNTVAAATRTRREVLQRMRLAKVPQPVRFVRTTFFVAPQISFTADDRVLVRAASDAR
jgi:hypothetical protein